MSKSPPPSALAVVTGATAGIGRAFAGHLARRGHPLLLLATNADRLEQAAAELRRECRVHVETLAVDLATEDGASRACARLDAEPSPGVLVNNAGFGTTGRLHRIDADRQGRMVRLHTLAPMLLTRAVLPAMVARGAGWIINVSSVAAFTFSPGNVNYSATKAYLTRFSEGLDAELRGTGVVVQALCPGFTRTEFHDRAGMEMRYVPEWLWMTTDAVVRASLGAAERGGPVVLVPGLRYRLITALLRLTPAGVMRWGSRVLKRDAG